MLERAAALKHDLGKYVAWRSANLDEALWTGPVDEELIDALSADILATRGGSDRTRTAWQVWSEHTDDLPRPLAEPELVRTEAAVNVLKAHEDALRQRDRAALASARGAIRQAQHEIRQALRDFHRRMLRQG